MTTTAANDSANKDSSYKTIVEGSASMTYPADQEQTVFYNPVQVQNRDLSILMMVLYSERRAIRKAVERKKRQLKQEKVPNIKEALQTFQESLQGAKVVKEQDDSDGLVILDALAASGLRSMRYWKEIPGIKHITINDLDPAAVDRAHTNAAVNNLTDMIVPSYNPGSDDASDPRPRGICIQQGDATHELYNSRLPPMIPVSETQPRLQQDATNRKPPWDVIDLDPYGSAAPFLDATLQGIRDGGFLCVTCTDMAALGGSHPETCFGRYASMPISRAGYLQELALRILLQSLATTAARYGRTIRPILSVGMNFYVRVFVEVYESKAACQNLSLQLGHVYQSTQCPSFCTVAAGQMGGKNNRVYQPGRAPGMCPETGASFKVGGPLWMGPLHDATVVQEALDRLQTKETEANDVDFYPKLKWIATKDRLRGLLQSCLEELPDVPLYYKLPEMSKTLTMSNPPLQQIKAALVNAGYRVSGYHKEPQAVKTDAPSTVVWDVLRAWAKKDPPKKTPPENSAAAQILAVEPTLEVDFTIPAELKKSKNGVARFPMNPQANWGPKPKASGVKRKAPEDEES